MLIHFKCNYDPAWDYPAICKKFFGENQCLCQAEKMMTNAHVHFQGETDMSAKQVETAMTELAATHYSKVTTPNGRPVRRVHGTVTEVGYQYLSKEGKDPLYSQRFSPSDIQKLREASEAHVDELKNGLSNHLFSISYSGTPDQVFDEMRLDALCFYEKEDKRPGPRFQKDVLWIMYRHPGTCEGWKRFVASRI